MCVEVTMAGVESLLPRLIRWEVELFFLVDRSQTRTEASLSDEGNS
jgi:hypothetical protein